EGEPVPTFYELAGDDGLVMYCGTFSKIIGAGMRLGWVVAHPTIIAHLSGLKTDAGTPAFASHVVAEFTSSGTLAEHITALKGLYRERRDIMLRALEATMPEGTSWTHPEGGFFIWLTLPGELTCAPVAQTCLERGVQVGQGPAFFTAGGGQQYIRLDYSFHAEEDVNRGIAILADVIKEQLASS